MPSKVATSLGRHFCTTGSHLKGNAMKKLITGALMSSIYYMVMASMIFGIYTGHSQFVGVSVAAFWLLIVLSIYVGFASALTVSSLDLLVGEPLKTTIESLKKSVKKSHIIFRIWGEIRFLTAVVLLAYSGWVFTAVCYVLASLFVRIIASVVRDKLKKYEEISGADWEEVLDQREQEQKHFSGRGGGYG